MKRDTEILDGASKLHNEQFAFAPRLILHSPDADSGLRHSYARALTRGKEILVVSAYLTHWSKDVDLNPMCNRFMMVVGKDFGLTRKQACRDVLDWLPSKYRANFRVADQIGGFHPKAVFWIEEDERAFAIIGSSNLSNAAFETNYEANVEVEISASAYEKAADWVGAIAKQSVPISEDWLANYEEAAQKGRRPSGSGTEFNSPQVFSLRLPRPKGTASVIKERRKQLAEYENNRNGLVDLFRRCASGAISSDEFYEKLPAHWGGDVGGRLQGKGWERRGRDSDFKRLSQAVVRILDASPADRDDVVIEEIDRLAKEAIPTRKAFLSEMLCLAFPSLYPVLNKPVHAFLNDVKFRGAAGLSEGAKYIDLSQRLRLSIAQNSGHPARNLAELDTVIWLAYRD